MIISSSLQTCSEEDQAKYFGEGLPRGMVKEFDVTKASSVMIRPRVLHLCHLLEKNVTGKSTFELRAEDAIGKIYIVVT